MNKTFFKLCIYSVPVHIQVKCFNFLHIWKQIKDRKKYTLHSICASHVNPSINGFKKNIHTYSLVKIKGIFYCSLFVHLREEEKGEKKREELYPILKTDNHFIGLAQFWGTRCQVFGSMINSC